MMDAYQVLRSSYKTKNILNKTLSTFQINDKGYELPIFCISTKEVPCVHPHQPAKCVLGQAAPLQNGELPSIS